MTISELAELSGVPTATIKYYVRDGLLPAGERLSAKQTDYSEAHLHRLRLVRAMLEVGKLSVASVLEVLSALDDPSLDIVYTFEVAQRSLARSAVNGADPSPEALARIDAVAARVGWVDCGGNVGRGMAARAIDAAEGAGVHFDDDFLNAYGDAADRVAEADLDALDDLPDRTRVAEVMVVGTVLGDPLAAGLRRMAQQHRSNAGTR